VATGGLLSVRLGQIRRRLRLHAALEGGIGGAALAMLALAAGVALARGRGGAPGAEVLAALILLGAATGALVRGARRIPLARCARLADAALDGQDRLLSALSLDTDEPSPFVRALVADAVRRAAILRPHAAVPARRPAGLPALGIATLALAGAALFPASSRAARVPPTTPRAERQAALPAGALDAEREVARAAAEAAARLGDARLAALAADFDRALRRLASGTLSDPAALDLLRALEARTAGAARAAKRDGQAAEAAARALEANAETRSAGEALGQTGGGPADDARASAALGASAAAHPAETARSLASAAAKLVGAAGKEGATGDTADAKDRPRRLSRDQSGAGTAPEETARAGDDPEARHLEQLRRDLDAAASACRAGDPGCREHAEERGRDLAQLGRQGATQDSLQRLQRSAEQLRARVSRGELGDGDAQAMRSFGRAAEGKGAAPNGTSDDVSAGAEAAAGNREDMRSGQANRVGNDADGEGDGARESRGGAETAAASAAMAAEGSGASEDQAGNGNGIGHQPGGAPLGARRGGPLAARGTESSDDVPIRDGAGPGRAEVIGTAAGRGFASPGYARAFNEYAAAVEDALGATAVPEGKRYLVRRYFDLIRPRPPAPGPRSSR
jgi:hypothetical protein